MTTVPKPSSLSNGLTLTYDAWNRLAEVKDGATVVARYEYDAQNRRIKKHLDSQSPGAPDGLDTYVHYFYNSSWQILETRQTTTESDQAENIQPKYQNTWSPRYIDAPILRDENTDQDSLCDDQRLYYLGDANFNVTSLVDTAGDAVEHYLYDPYGTVTIYDATWSSTRSTSSYNNPVLYTGREQDPESGLMHYRNRYYSTELGRFISRDPIGYVGGQWNVYEYVSSTPASLTDPTGEKVEVCCRGTNINCVVDGVAECLEAKHCWLRTGSIEAGMGPAGGGVPGNDKDCPCLNTTINDHAGEGNKRGSNCVAVPGCNETCINSMLMIGTPTGMWVPGTSDCNTLARDILKKCNCHNKCLKWKTVWANPPISQPIKVCVKWLIGDLGTF